MECCSKNRPSRSDVHLSAEQDAEIEQQTRGYFDGVAPKRHTKPQRSDPSAQYLDSPVVDASIPEYLEFQRLQEVDTQKVCDSGSNVSEGAVTREEFVETDYYQDLNCVDKQHHTTGTGFIKMEAGGDGKLNNFSLAPDHDDQQHHPTSHRGNPATNDWIPDSSTHAVIFDSDKPRRSEN